MKQYQVEKKYIIQLVQIAQNKINNTKKENNSYNISELEEESYILLKKKYINIIRQYGSKEYPFSCDFYIPLINTYIEFNYHWMQGFHPYNENDIDDINK